MNTEKIYFGVMFLIFGGASVLAGNVTVFWIGVAMLAYAVYNIIQGVRNK